MVVLPGFEPGTPSPKAGMIDRYTTGLCCEEEGPIIYYMTGRPVRWVGLAPSTVTRRRVPMGWSPSMPTGR